MSVARGRCWRGLFQWWKPSQRSGPRDDTTTGPDETSSTDRSPGTAYGMGSFESGYPGPASEALVPDARMYSWVGDYESTEAELAEFLACDLESTEADPRFREELREQLWTLVEEGELLRRRDH